MKKWEMPVVEELNVCETKSGDGWGADEGVPYVDSRTNEEHVGLDPWSLFSAS